MNKPSELKEGKQITQKLPHVKNLALIATCDYGVVTVGVIGWGHEETVVICSADSGDELELAEVDKVWAGLLISNGVE